MKEWIVPGLVGVVLGVAAALLSPAVAQQQQRPVGTFQVSGSGEGAWRVNTTNGRLFFCEASQSRCSLFDGGP